MRQTLVIAALCVVLIGACKSKQDDRAAIDRLQELNSRLVSCHGQQCLDDDAAAFAKWQATYMKADQKPTHDIDVLLHDHDKFRHTVMDDGPIPTVTRYKNQMCACADASCTKGVRAGADQEREGFSSWTLSDADKKTVDDLWNQLVACNAKLVPPSTPPPTP
jgi:hypothetical protein